MLRREKVYEKRAVYRIPFREIAKELGVSVSVVHDDAKFISKLKAEGMAERDLEIAADLDTQDDALTRRWMPVALSPDDAAASVATDKILKINDQRAKRHGLYQKEGVDAKELGKGLAEGAMSVIAHMRELANSPIKTVEATEVNAVRPLLQQRS